METPYEKIRAISTTFRGDRFAVAEFNSNVQVWDLNKGLVNKFVTDFDAGDKRLSISQDGKYLAVGGYSANTITVYKIDTGQMLWQRKDLKKCGNVTILDKFNNQLFVNLERQGTHILDIDTGETIESLKGVEHHYENSIGAIDLLGKSTTISLVDRTKGKTLKSLPKTTFAILDACFTLNEVAVTYSTNPLELIDFASYKTKWTTSVVGHFLTISYSEEQKTFHGVRWDFNVGGFKFLCYINPENGTVKKEIDLGEPIETEFLSEGKFLLTSKGQLIDTSSGKQIKEFDFEAN
jgi:hypothetical protein